MRHFLLLLLFAPPLLAQAADTRVDTAVDQALQERGLAQVVILFEPDQPTTLDVAGRAERRASVARTTDSVLQSAGAGFAVSHRFELISALYGQVDMDGFRALQAHPQVRAIGLDMGGSGHNDVALPLLGFDQLQAERPEGLGLDGDGIKVVVLDSGIDAGHLAFEDALVDEACFCFNPNGHCCPNGEATQFGDGAADDDHGHGTWVSGQIVGRGVNSPIGAAPAADLVAVKMLDSGNGFWSTGDIAASYEWVALNHPDAAVLNASLGTFMTFTQTCDSAESWAVPVSQAAALLTANGTVLTASTGNQAATGIQLPSCLADVIAVGGTWSQDFPGTWFGTLCGEAQVNPLQDDIACFSNTASMVDLLAPAVPIQTTALGGGQTGGLFGTSFAAPLVAGCATLIRQFFPDESPAQIKQRMLQSPLRLNDTRIDQDFPRLDCLHAIERLFVDRFE